MRFPGSVTERLGVPAGHEPPTGNDSCPRPPVTQTNVMTVGGGSAEALVRSDAPGSPTSAATATAPISHRRRRPRVEFALLPACARSGARDKILEFMLPSLPVIVLRVLWRAPPFSSCPPTTLRSLESDVNPTKVRGEGAKSDAVGSAHARLHLRGTPRSRGADGRGLIRLRGVHGPRRGGGSALGKAAHGAAGAAARPVGRRAGRR